MSEAARGRGMGVTGASPRARGTDEARGDSLGAPRPPVVADLASPHGTLVGGHRRAACPDGTPRDVREAALSAPSFVHHRPSGVSWTGIRVLSIPRCRGNK